MILSKLFNRQISLDLSNLTDCHSHILPGVDDGVQSMEEALEILSAYEEMGIREVWLTPHIMEDVPNTPQGLNERFQELTQAYTGPIRLHLAAEHMIDNAFMPRLEAGEVMPHGRHKNMLLVETSYFNPPLQFEDTLKRVKSKGYFPILAHPERYRYILDLAGYRHLKNLGVKFQLNLLSLSGMYGREAAAKARDMLKNNMYDFVGSDIHTSMQLDPLRHLAVTRSQSEAIRATV